VYTNKHTSTSTTNIHRIRTSIRVRVRTTNIHRIRTSIYEQAYEFITRDTNKHTSTSTTNIHRIRTSIRVRVRQHPSYTNKHTSTSTTNIHRIQTSIYEQAYEFITRDTSTSSSMSSSTSTTNLSSRDANRVVRVRVRLLHRIQTSIPKRTVRRSSPTVYIHTVHKHRSSATSTSCEAIQYGTSIHTETVSTQRTVRRLNIKNQC